jgi:hypothetical protein
MFRTHVIVMSAILAMAFCFPGLAEARGDHNGSKHRYLGRPFRALLNHINELEAKLEALSATSSTSSTTTPPSVAAPQVSFLATLGSDFAALNSNRVIFDFVVWDDGSNYDPTSGVYTVPESGVYRFDTTVFYDPASTLGRTSAVLQILFNGSAFDIARQPITTPTNSEFHSVSGGITVRLAQGDLVQVLYSGPTIHQSIFPGVTLGGTRFSGHQLYSSEGP